MGVFGQILSGILGDDGGKLGNIGGGLGIASEFTSGKTSDGLTIGGAGAGLLGSIQGIVQNAKGGAKKNAWGIADNVFGGLGAIFDGATGITGLTGNEKTAGILRMTSGAVGSLGGVVKGGKAIWDLLHLRKEQASETRTKDDIEKDKANAYQNLFGGGMQLFRGITNMGQGYYRMKGDSESTSAKNWGYAGKAASIAAVLPGLFGSFKSKEIPPHNIDNNEEEEDSTDN